MAKVISMTWAGWQESRAAKRANLARLGLDVPSCRKTDHGTAGRRLRKAFEGQRVPRFGSRSQSNPGGDCPGGDCPRLIRAAKRNIDEPVFAKLGGW